MQHEESKRDYWGHQYQFIGFDELTEFTESQYLYMMARCRSPYPGLNPRMRSTTNPGNRGHVWVKERFVDVATPGHTYTDPKTGLTRMFIPGRVYDNPTLMDNDPGYISRLESMATIDQRRLLHGDWEVFEGQVFSELSQRVHGCDPFDIPPEWEKFMVLDWGFAKPFSVGWYAVDYDKNLYRYREWYGCKEGEPDIGLRMVAEDVARGILERETEKIRTRWADPSIFNATPRTRRGECRGPTIGSDFQGQGI